MSENVAFIYKEYRIEFCSDGISLNGEAYYPGEKMPVGTVNGHFYNSKDKNDKTHRKDNALHIDLLIVSDKHNNKGIGTTLMKMTMLYAEKNKVKRVTTTPSPIGNMTAKNLEKFYRKFHFSTGIMVKRIEFVSDDDFLEEFEEENFARIGYAASTTYNSNNKDNHVGRTTESVDPFKQVDEAILQENIEEAFRLLDEEVDKIKAKKEILKEISEKNGLPENYDELKDETEQNEAEEFDSEEFEDEVISDNYNTIGGLTTVYFIEEKLPKQSRILDIKDTIIEHRTYFLNKGHQIISPETLDLSKFEDSSLNVVLCIGPMDELKTKEEQKQFLNECYRICKPGGRIFVSFLSNDMMIVNQVMNDSVDFLRSENVDKKTLKVLKTEKSVFTMQEMEEFLEEFMEETGMRYVKKFAMDGISGLMEDKINAMTQTEFGKWVKYHLYSCEKEEILGYSTSIVYIIKK